MLNLFPLNNLKGIIFDCDGVLFDTESIYLQKKEDFLKQKGIIATNKELSKMIGFAFPQALKLCYPDLVNSDEIAKEYYSQCHYELIDYKTIFDEDAAKILPMLKERGLKIGCASNCNLVRLTQALKENGIYDYFDCVISMEMVKKGKPDPAVYLYALNELGISADQCLAIEDSVAGIKAAKRAGCKVAAKKYAKFEIDQSESDVVIESLCEIATLMNI